MLHPATYIEQKLDHAAFWARLIAWLRITSVLGICVAASALLMGGAMTRHWLTSSWVAGSLFTATFLGAGIAWAIVSLYIVLKPLDRRALARAVERIHGEPFDRVSAAVHMEGTRWRAADPLQHTFYERIQAQAGAVLRRRPGARPFSMANALTWAVAFAVLALFTIWFYAHFRPLRNVQASEPSPDTNVVQPDEPDAGLEIPPEKNVEEPERPWGEVRISEPGANLRITALDSVALQIEAAASSSIKSVVWKLAKNGGPEEVRTLGPPSDPYYAVYRDEIDAVALQLADWDVVSYFAVAETNDGKTYQSDVYFLDVMPLAQELEDLPGGYEGSAYQALNELTRMLDEQEEVVRRTHRQAAASDPNVPELAAERDALGQKQADLQRDLRHLQARLNAEFPESEEPSWRKSLDAATESLERTKNALREPDLAEARDSARDTHAKLAEARNRLFDDVRKSSPTTPTKPANDDASPTKPDSPAGTPNESAADSPAESLSSPEQWRDELDQMAASDAERKTDRDFVAQMAERERNLASRIPPQNPQVGKQLSPEQQQINQAFEGFLEQNPQLTHKNGQPEVGQAVADAHKALQQTHQKLNQGAPFANQDAATAAQKLDKLADAIQQADPQQKLNEAYQLKKLLEQQSRFLEQVQQTPEKFDSNQLQKSSDAIRDTTERLNNLANTPPTRDEFQQPLRDSLNDASRENIAKQCNGMCQNPGGGQSGQSAGQLKQSLDSISQAFEQSVRTPQPSQSQPSPPQSGQQQSGQQQSGQQQSGQQQSGQQQSGQQQSGQQQSGQQQSGQQQSGQSQGAGSQANRSRWSGEDRLRDRAHESLERGIRQVESLARDAERRGRQATQSSDGRDNPSTDPRESGRLTADQRRQLRSEASRNLNAGIYGTYGHNDRTESVVRGIEERLADERQPIDGQIVEEMLRTIQDVRRERASAAGENASDADVSRGASTAVPPAYRAPVQKYFQKLSEQR